MLSLKFGLIQHRNDFWGQVKRTVNGTPVSQRQIELTVAMIKLVLETNGKDRLLDPRCGNGALDSLVLPVGSLVDTETIVAICNTIKLIGNDR